MILIPVTWVRQTVTVVDQMFLEGWIDVYRGQKIMNYIIRTSARKSIVPRLMLRRQLEEELT